MHDLAVFLGALAAHAFSPFGLIATAVVAVMPRWQRKWLAVAACAAVGAAAIYAQSAGVAADLRLRDPSIIRPFVFLTVWLSFVALVSGGVATLINPRPKS